MQPVSISCCGYGRFSNRSCRNQKKIESFEELWRKRLFPRTCAIHVFIPDFPHYRYE